MSKGQINSEVKMSKECCPDVFCQTGQSEHKVSCYNEIVDQIGQSSQNERSGGCVKESVGHLCGDHETQVSEGGEADLHKHLSDCKKNPGHTEFIPVDTFTLNHLPEGHHDIDLYEFIKLTADSENCC